MNHAQHGALRPVLTLTLAVLALGVQSGWDDGGCSAQHPTEAVTVS